MEAAPDQRRRGMLLGLLAAATFGVSAPLAKRLLPEAGPLAIAGFLYLGAGVGLTLYGLGRRLLGAPPRGAPLGRADLLPLGVIALSGAVVAPVLMLVGLGRLSAVGGTLLLNLEAPATILLAIACFGEHLSRREAVAALVILLGAAVVGFAPGQVAGDGWGVLAIAGACACWALDNNLSQRLSGRDPIAVVRAKALAGCACSLALAVAIAPEDPRDGLPSPAAAGAILALGALSYGASVVLDLQALRLLGAAREAAIFASAPFLGALAAVALERRLPSLPEAVGGLVLGAGVLALFRARHGHPHQHEAQEHEHLHDHDAHHRHEHPAGIDPAGPHSHLHRHAALVHDHPHVSEEHHRHRH